MLVRVALLDGCYLITSDQGATLVRCRDSMYSPDDLLPAMTFPHSPPAVTAREFVRQSMVSLSGTDETAWPKIARTFVRGGSQ